jgi:hypothetical protein
MQISNIFHCRFDEATFMIYLTNKVPLDSYAIQ